MLPHQTHLPRRRARIPIPPIIPLHKPIPRTRLHKRHAHARADFAQPHNLPVAEVVVLEDDLENAPAVARDGVIDLGDFGLDVAPVVAEHFADVHDHVDLHHVVCAAAAGSAHGGGGFEDFDGGGGVAVREADDGTDADGGGRGRGGRGGVGGRGRGEDLSGQRDAVGFDAGGRDVVGEGEVEAMGDVGVGHGWVEEGVVDHFGEEGEGDADAGGGCRGCHCCLFEWLRFLEGELDGRMAGGNNWGDKAVVW